MVLSRGRESYREVDNAAIALLQGLTVLPVQRNSGIDAFLKDASVDSPIPVRVQRPDESLWEAGMRLHEASRGKHIHMMVLVATGDGLDLGMESLLPQSIVVVNSTANSIRKALQDRISAIRS
jgi:site-specific DNA-methyltransferase (adenine-specific)